MELRVKRTVWSSISLNFRPVIMVGRSLICVWCRRPWSDDGEFGDWEPELGSRWLSGKGKSRLHLLRSLWTGPVGKRKGTKSPLGCWNGQDAWMQSYNSKLSSSPGVLLARVTWCRVELRWHPLTDHTDRRSSSLLGCGVIRVVMTPKIWPLLCLCSGACYGEPMPE